MSQLFNDEIIPPSYEMSPLFLLLDQDNKIKMILSVIIDGTLAIISMIIKYNGCNVKASQGIMDWNTQWMIYLYAKTFYHLIVCLQLLSKSKQRELCHKLGLLRAPQEDPNRYEDFRMLNEVELQDYKSGLTSEKLNKQYASFYYQRNKILKLFYFVKGLATLIYVIFGIVEFLQEPNFSLVFVEWQGYKLSCQADIAWFSFISIGIVIFSNRGVFDVAIFIAAVLVILLVVVLPYCINRMCQVHRRLSDQQQQLLKTIQFSNGAVEGDGDCSICQMGYVIDEEVIILPCNKLHHFHKSCISTWLNYKSTCPLCRQDISQHLEDEEEQQ